VPAILWSVIALLWCIPVPLGLFVPGAWAALAMFAAWMFYYRASRPLGFGIALHRGKVTYGNIGTPDRLEFSVIGTAANEAARIEAMCKTLEVSPIVSAAFASHLPDRLRSLGRHALRGVAEPQELYTLRA